MSNQNKIREQFELWNQALQTGDPDRVVACYAQEAVFLPTLSARVRTRPEEIRDYFVHFLSKAPMARIREQHIRIFENIAVNSGLYVFSLLDGERRADLSARFTFVYQRFPEGWLIIEHHSSLVPAQ